MNRDTGVACLALALLLIGMSVAGRFAVEEDEPMKDPQQHNHQAWQDSPYGRNWLAEAERKSRVRDIALDKNSHPPRRNGNAEKTRGEGKQKSDPD